MAGKIIADTIQTENSFLTLNVGTTRIATMNASGIFSNTGGKIIGSDGTFSNSTIVTPTISGNLSFDSTGTTGVRSPAANTLTFHTTGNEDVRIDSAGNVGIGTTSPATKLHVTQSNSALPALQLQHGDGDFILMEEGGGTDLFKFTRIAGTNDLQINNLTSNNIRFATANTEQMRLTFAGDLQFNSGYGSVATAYGCRAWVNFNGTGTVAIRASGNVSSITDNGTGDYTVNFTSGMPDTNYSVSGLGQFDQSPSASSPALVSIYRSSTALQTSSCRILSSNSNSTSTVDFPTITIAVFR